MNLRISIITILIMQKNSFMEIITNTLISIKYFDDNTLYIKFNITLPAGGVYLLLILKLHTRVVSHVPLAL